MKARILVGPTAVGKSAVAQYIAERDGSVIISADSMLVYKGMNIGTAKPSIEERCGVTYLGVDCVSPGEPFSTGDWLNAVRNGNRTLPDGTSHIVAGGTGLYIRALLCGLSANASCKESRNHWTSLFESGGLNALKAAMHDLRCEALLAPGDSENPRRMIRALERAETGDTKRGDWDEKPAGSLPPVAGITMSRDLLAARISRRIEKMFTDGIVEEAIAIRESCSGLSQTACQAIGYAEALAVADGTMKLQEAKERIAARTRQLAKRQATWFRHQLNVKWIEISPDDPVDDIADKVTRIWSENGETEFEI